MKIVRRRTDTATGRTSTDIAIGGATLAAEAAASGLFDEYRARVYLVLAGGGTPFHPQRGRRVSLELVETPTFDSGVVHLRHRAARWPARRPAHRQAPQQGGLDARSADEFRGPGRSTRTYAIDPPSGAPA